MSRRKVREKKQLLERERSKNYRVVIENGIYAIFASILIQISRINHSDPVSELDFAYMFLGNERISLDIDFVPPAVDPFSTAWKR